jgi:CheY-like chemotaxis protein
MLDESPRILLADDHTMLLDAFRRLLEPRYEIIGTACDGRELVELAGQHPARCDCPRHLDAGAQRHGRLRAASPKNTGHEVRLSHGK